MEIPQHPPKRPKVFQEVQAEEKLVAEAATPRGSPEKNNTVGTNPFGEWWFHVVYMVYICLNMFIYVYICLYMFK